MVFTGGRGPVGGYVMRKAMICASVLLALFQVWSMVFTHSGARAPSAASVVAAAPRAVLAVAAASTAPSMTEVAAQTPAPKSCYRQYQAKFRQCQTSDQACHVKAADQWDLCEATGLWPQ